MSVKEKNRAPGAEAHLKKTRAAKNRERAFAQSFRVPAPEEKVGLSAKAKPAEENAKRLLTTVPETRKKTAACLRKKIKNGTYRIDGRAVAAKMIKEALLHEVLLDKTEEH